MRVLVADEFSPDHLGDLEALGLDVTYDPESTADDLAFRAPLTEANILIVRSTRVTRSTIETARRLGLVIRAGAGFDTIDVAAASERGILVSNCPGKNSVAVAELAMGLVLAPDRRIPGAGNELRAALWKKTENGKAEGLKGKTRGIAGPGGAGTEAAK